MTADYVNECFVIEGEGELLTVLGSTNGSHGQVVCFRRDSTFLTKIAHQRASCAHEYSR